VTDRPTFVPTADGLRDVLGRAGARRRRRIAVTAGGAATAAVAATVVAVVAVAPGAGAGEARLRVVPASPAPASPPTPGPTAQKSPSTQPPTGAPQPASVVGGSGAAASGPFAPAPGTDSPTPTAPTYRHSAPAPITRTTVGYDSAACDATNDVVGWCVAYTGPDRGRRKHPVHLSMELCRPQVNGDGTIHFSDSREIDLEVLTSDGSRQWQAGQGEKYRSPGATVVVRAGSCLRWVASWDTISPDGFYAPPGSYSISYAIDTSDFGTTYGGPTLQLSD
jgi:hypothetical protein